MFSERKLTINGVDLDFDTFDEADVQRFDEVVGRIKKNAKSEMVSALFDKGEIPEFKGESGTSIVKDYKAVSEAIRSMLDELFGAGTTERLLGDHKANVGNMVTLYVEMIAAIKVAHIQFFKSMEEMASKFIPLGEKGA